MTQNKVTRSLEAIVTYFRTPKVTETFLVGNLVYDPKRLRDIRGRNYLLYDPKGHGDVFGKFDIVYDPKRSQGH